METIKGWHENQRAQSLFNLREGENPLLKFVQVGKANRNNSAEQAKRLTILRAVGAYMGWLSWVSPFCDFIEDYQTTCGAPHSAREMLLSAVQFTEWEANNRNKSTLTIASGGEGKK